MKIEFILAASALAVAAPSLLSRAAESVGQAASSAETGTPLPRQPPGRPCVAETGREVGHETAEAGRKVGHETAKAGRTVGHETAEAGRKTKKAVKPASSPS